VNLPTYAADAFYHHKLPPELTKDLQATLKEVEEWAMGGYLSVLNKGDDATPEERKAAVEKLARYTGLEPRYVDNSNLRITVSRFTRELLRNEKLEIGRYDGRLTGPAPLDAGERADFDPSGTQPRPPFQAAFQHYIKSELNYETDLRYYVQGGIMAWDWGQGNRMADTTDMLQNAFQKNPYFKVMVVAGYYDLATPYFSVKYTMNHLGIQPDAQKRITWQFYDSGHMVYIEKNSRAKLKKDFADFVHSATGATQ